RVYDVFSGKWMSVDPQGFDADDTNLYRYVKNSPTKAVDPSGRELIAVGDGALSDVLWQIKYTLGWSGEGYKPPVDKLEGDVGGKPVYLIRPGYKLLVRGWPPVGDLRAKVWSDAHDRAARWAAEHGGDLYPSDIFWSIGDPLEHR